MQDGGSNLAAVKNQGRNSHIIDRHGSIFRTPKETVWTCYTSSVLGAPFAASYMIGREDKRMNNRNNTQTAVINIINLRIIYKLDASYASQHTLSKVTVTIF